MSSQGALHAASPWVYMEVLAERFPKGASCAAPASQRRGAKEKKLSASLRCIFGGIMKILMFYAPLFWYRTHQKTLPDVPDREEEHECRNSVVIFFHAEAHDEDRQAAVVEKWVKNAKWLARKFDTTTVVLHSFNHLAPTKASPETARALTEAVHRRLERTGFTVVQTPFGYLNEWKIHVAGDSLAKVFKDL